MSSNRVGEGRGVQLSYLRALARKVSQNKILYYFLEDVEFEDKERVIDFKAGYSFSHDRGRDVCYCEANNSTFSLDSIQGICDKFEQRTFNQYTVQDVSDLARLWISKVTSDGEALINMDIVPSFRKSKPLECSYVICPRNVNFNQLVASLNKHVQQKKVYVNEEDYYVWIDIFCSSLYQNKELSDEEELRQNLCNMEQDMSRFLEVLIFFDSIREPLALRRLWCIWELYTASKVSHHTPLSILFPSKISISTFILLDFDVLIETVLGLDPMALESANTTASNTIRHLLTTLDEGFNSVINTIKATLCSWLTTLVIREYDGAQNINKSLVLVTELYLDVGMFLINISGNDRNARICKDKATEILENKKFESFFKENKAKILCETKRELLKEKILLRQGALFISQKMSTFQKKFDAFKKELKMPNFKIEEFIGGSNVGRGFTDPKLFARLATNKKQPIHTHAHSAKISKHSGQIPQLSKNGFSMLSTKAFPSVQTVRDHLQSSRYLAGKFRDKRSSEEKVIDVQLQLLVAQRQYELAAKIMNVVLSQYNENDGDINKLFGGLSAATLNFKCARDLFQRGGEEQSFVQAQKQYKRALNLALNGDVYQRKFIREKCAYYLALSFAQTNPSNVFAVLRDNFFMVDGENLLRRVSIEDPYIIGCTRRAAQVFFLLEVHAPAQVKKGLEQNTTFEEIANRICISLFGTSERDSNGDTLEEYINKLRDALDYWKTRVMSFDDS